MLIWEHADIHKTLNYKIKKERELQSAFHSLYEKIMYFKDINNDFKELLNSNKNKSKDIIMALCNALYEEIENYKDIEKKLKAYNDYYNLSQLIDSINNPKNPSEKIMVHPKNGVIEFLKLVYTHGYITYADYQ